MAQEIIEKRGLNYAALSKAIGKNPSYVQQWIKYETPLVLPEGVRHALAKELGVHERDLRSSLSSSFDPDELDQIDEIAAAANSFPPDAIKELAAVAGMGSGQTIDTVYVKDGAEFVQRDAVKDDYWRLPQSFVRSVLGAHASSLLIVECRGDSMSPTLQSGDRVIANTAWTKPTPDGLFAIRDALDEIVVKRLELFGRNPPRIRIISDNPAHPKPEEVGLEDIIIIGKVVMGLKRF